MNRQEYLNQISATNRPTKKPKNKILSSKFFQVGLIGIVVFTIIIIIGSVIGGSRSSLKDRLIALILRIDNTSRVIDEYRNQIKSSKLRSDSAMLHSVLSSTNQDLNTYAVSKYNFNGKDIKKSIDQEETLAHDELTEELFEAKINGNLDSTYATKMTYEISLITAREVQIINALGDDTFAETLTLHYDNLDKLYSEFSNFSE